MGCMLASRQPTLPMAAVKNCLTGATSRLGSSDPVAARALDARPRGAVYTHLAIEDLRRAVEKLEPLGKRRATRAVVPRSARVRTFLHVAPANRRNVQEQAPPFGHVLAEEVLNFAGAVCFEQLAKGRHRQISHLMNDLSDSER